MTYSENRLYHIYNQGNNKQPIFFNRENYIFLLKKVRHTIVPHCDLLAYCLMPNHFHFLINTNQESIKKVKVGIVEMSQLSKVLRVMLSSYTKAINNQENRSGSLFRQKTKAKLLDESDAEYPFICFNYIHQNPMKAGLVQKMEDWEFSSFRDYCGMRKGTLCNQLLAEKKVDFDRNNFHLESYAVIPDNALGFLF